MDLNTECEERQRAQSAGEVENFLARKVDGPILGYFKLADANGPTRITTAVGDLLATVTELRPEYRCCTPFGNPSVRQNFLAWGIDSRAWSGTYFKSSGEYVRMHVVER